MVYSLEDVRVIIRKAAPKILKHLVLDNLICRELAAEEVITPSVKDRLSADKLTPHEKIDIILDHLNCGPVRSFLLFCKIMHEDGRTQILDDLGVNINDIYAQLGTPPVANGSSVAECAAAGEGRKCLTEDVPLWDPTHPDGQDLFQNHPIGDKLRKSVPTIKDVVCTADLWALLIQYDAMKRVDVDRCKLVSPVEQDQVEKIIEFLEKKPIWRTHAFFRALAKTTQEHIIDMVLGPNKKALYTQNLKDC